MLNRSSCNAPLNTSAKTTGCRTQYTCTTSHAFCFCNACLAYVALPTLVMYDAYNTCLLLILLHVLPMQFVPDCPQSIPCETYPYQWCTTTAVSARSLFYRTVDTSWIEQYGGTTLIRNGATCNHPRWSDVHFCLQYALLNHNICSSTPAHRETITANATSTWRDKSCQTNTAKTTACRTQYSSCNSSQRIALATYDWRT